MNMGSSLSVSAVRVNQQGRVVGESHHNAKLSDDAVRRLVFDRTDPNGPQLSWRELAKKYGCSVRAARDYVGGARRADDGRDTGRVSLKRMKIQKSRLNLFIPAYLVPKFRQLGGSHWLAEKILKE